MPDDEEVGGCIEPDAQEAAFPVAALRGSAPRYPGADWRGPGGNGRSCSFRSQSFHEAVTTAETSVAGWNAGARACHGFVGRYGNAEQYADFHEAVNGTLNGNPEVTTWESWDGLLPATNRSPDGSFGPNDRGWNAEQCERIADIIAFGDIDLGIPIRWMNTTREAGNAPHRLGVPSASGAVYIGYGPDKWTNHPGKQCPGDKRVLQLRDSIIPRARVIAAAIRAGRCGYLPRGNVNLPAALARTGDQPTKEWDELATKDEIRQVVAEEVAKRISPQIVNDVVANVLRAPEFRLSLGNIVKDRQADAFVATTAVLHSPEFAGWQEVTRRAAAAILKEEPPPVQKTYTVVAGDTLGSIAKKHGVTVEQLVEWNGISDPNNIAVGQVLKVSGPGKA